MILRPPVWVVELAARFWATAPEVPSFPRNLADVLLWVPHIQVHELSNLTLARAAAFLERVGVPFRVEVADRPLRGCLATFEGRGIILIDADDDQAERRFTLAHELAHFLRDYHEPRSRAVSHLGEVVLEVVDRKRPATFEERLTSVLRSVTLGCHTHLLARNEHGNAESLEIREAEEAADRLAFELLAPFENVLAEPPTSCSALVANLISRFGLPPLPAAKYAILLLGGKISPLFTKN